MGLDLSLTKHARIRLQQRGLLETDVDLIVRAGTPVDEESVLLRNKDVDMMIRSLKKKISRLQKLRGCRVVIGETNEVITAYRATQKNAKRMLRGTYKGGLR